MLILITVGLQIQPSKGLKGTEGTEETEENKKKLPAYLRIYVRRKDF